MKYLRYTYPAILIWLVGTVAYDLMVDKSGAGWAIAMLVSSVMILGGLAAFVIQSVRYFIHRRRTRARKGPSSER